MRTKHSICVSPPTPFVIAAPIVVRNNRCTTPPGAFSSDTHAEKYTIFAFDSAEWACSAKSFCRMPLMIPRHQIGRWEFKCTRGRNGGCKAAVRSEEISFPSRPRMIGRSLSTYSTTGNMDSRNMCLLVTRKDDKNNPGDSYLYFRFSGDSSNRRITSREIPRIGGLSPGRFSPLKKFLPGRFSLFFPGDSSPGDSSNGPGDSSPGDSHPLPGDSSPGDSSPPAHRVDPQIPQIRQHKNHRIKEHEVSLLSLLSSTKQTPPMLGHLHPIPKPCMSLRAHA